MNEKIKSFAGYLITLYLIAVGKRHLHNFDFSQVTIRKQKFFRHSFKGMPRRKEKRILKTVYCDRCGIAYNGSKKQYKKRSLKDKICQV